MARVANKLTARTVATLRQPGMHADGNGLYLQVTTSGAKTWIFRYSKDGRRRDMGLGSVRDVDLAKARTKAGNQRKLLDDGIDPLQNRKAEQRQATLDAARTMTFKACAEAFIGAHEPGWRNPKHRQQWRNTLSTYAYPVFGAISVQDVDTDLVMKVLEPIWTAKPETASRLRGRIESILDYAKAREYRTGENPARWRGHVANLLPKRSKVKAVEHHAAIAYEKIGAFMADLRARDAVSSRALEFAILTAARSSEVLGAQWPEIDLEKKVWTVPGARMKAGREHRVPLGVAALAILKEMKKAKESEFVFPGAKKDRPLSVMALTMVLRRMDRTDITVHGFRSAFRDWTAERTAYPRDVAEMALAHTIGDKVEAAYRRGDLFAKRRKMMDDWAAFCAKAPAASANNVVPIKGAM